jgi:hypothetical protein
VSQLTQRAMRHVRFRGVESPGNTLKLHETDASWAVATQQQPHQLLELPMPLLRLSRHRPQLAVRGSALQQMLFLDQR